MNYKSIPIFITKFTMTQQQTPIHSMGSSSISGFMSQARTDITGEFVMYHYDNSLLDTIRDGTRQTVLSYVDDQTDIITVGMVEQILKNDPDLAVSMTSEDNATREIAKLLYRWKNK